MIEFEHVGKKYPDGTVAVADASFTVASHTTTVLLGTSGSGKTTLLRMVNRMAEPTSGRVLWDKRDIAEMDPVPLRRSIGYVLQEGGLFPHRTVLDNIATIPVLEGIGRARARAEAGRLLQLVGLDSGFATRYPSQLSGGQRQRVGVARALANRPLVLLMDEPFGALDPLVRADLQNQLMAIRAELGTTILFVTHDVDEAMLLGHQIIVLSAGGRIEQAGTPEDIAKRPASPFVADFIGRTRP